MSDTKRKIKYVLKYLSSIFTWALFVILISFAILLAYYFVTSKLGNKGGIKSQPAFSIYTIVSGSMIPTINVYDVIINVKVDDPSSLEVGNIITFKSTSSISYGMTVTHRIKDIQIVDGEYQYITKGDNNMIQDGAPALYSNLIGRAVLRIPYLGKIQFFVAKPIGWVSIVLVPALFIIISDVIKIIRVSKIKKNADKYNNNIVNINNKN